MESNRRSTEALVLLRPKALDLKVRWPLKHFDAFVLEAACASVGRFQPVRLQFFGLRGCVIVRLVAGACGEDHVISI